jgi:periplasmic protein TonB
MRDDKMLSACLMDSDIGAKQDRRARWRGAMVVALALEAVLAAWLLLWPILTPGGPPPDVIILPRIFPEFTRDRIDRKPSRPMSSKAVSFGVPIFPPLRAPSRIPSANADPPANSAPPAIGSGVPDIPGAISGLPSGLGDSNLGMSAPPQPKPPRTIRTSEGVQSAMLIHRVEPLYPRFARTAHISGTVELRAIIGRDGRVNSVEMLSGNPLLTRAAIEAVRQWRYRPTILDGEAVEVETRITVNFVLGQ